MGLGAKPYRIYEVVRLIKAIEAYRQLIEHTLCSR